MEKIAKYLKHSKLTKKEEESLWQSFKRSPYSIGAERVRIENEHVVLSFSNEVQQQEAEEKLIEMGIKKPMRRHKLNSAFQFKYETIVDIN